MMKMYDWQTKLTFGKYKGHTLKKIFDTDESYIFWCLENVESFCITNEIFSNLSSIVYYNKAKKIYLETGYSLDIMLQFQGLYDYLLKIHDKKTEIYKIQEQRFKEMNDREDNDEYSNGNYNYNNWLIDAAGTDDPNTLKDVYWNLD